MRGSKGGSLMPWGRFDDKFHRNVKVKSLRRRGDTGMCALGVWNFWLSWCLDDPAFDGRIPACELTAVDDRATPLLLEVGLWERAGDDYLIHDFDDYAKPEVSAEKKREADRERIAKKRESERESRESSGDVAATVARQAGDSSGDGRDKASATSRPPVPVPVPVPVPEPEQNKNGDCEGGASPPLRPAPSPPAVVLVEDRRRRPSAPRKDPLGHQIATAATWDAYRVAYRERYDAEPTRNAKVNGQVSHFVQRVPHAEAPDIAAHYVGSNNARYVSAGHAWGPLVQDAEKLRTEWLTGRSVTSYGAQQADRKQGRAEAYAPMLDRLRAEDEADAEAPAVGGVA
jgi:hypothetical protein